MKSKITALALFTVILVAWVGFVYYSNMTLAYEGTHQYQIYLLNEYPSDMRLLSGTVNIEKHTVDVEFMPSDIKNRYISVAEVVNDFTQLKLIGSFEAKAQKITNRYIGVVHFANAKLVKDKIYVVWWSREKITSIQANVMREMLLRTKTIVAEQNRISDISAYKQVEDVIYEATRNYVP